MAKAWIEMPLTQGKRMLIDTDDYEQVRALMPWFAHRERRNWYAHRMIRRPDGTKAVLRVHTLLTGYRLVDHKNRNGLDNRRENMVDSTVADNCRNSRRRVDNSSGLTGVSYCKATGQWKVQVAVNGKRIWLGRHLTPEAAYAARCEYLAAL